MIRWHHTRIRHLIFALLTLSILSCLWTISVITTKDDNRQMEADKISSENNDHAGDEDEDVEPRQETKKQPNSMSEQANPGDENTISKQTGSTGLDIKDRMLPDQKQGIEINHNEDDAHKQTYNKSKEKELELSKILQEKKDQAVNNHAQNIIPKPAETMEASVNGKPNILLLTYLRSGSSFTGAILQRSPEVFYMFEPIKGLLQSINHGNAYYTLNGVCSLLGGCRKPQTLEETFGFVSEIIKNLYRCKITMVTKAVTDTIIDLPLSNIRDRFGDCYNVTHDRRACLDETFNNCSNRARVIKFIRLSSEVVGRLMRSVPNLKVIHLLRDPRGILKSRQHVGLLPGTKYNISSQQTCGQMQNDIQETKTLQRQYPGRIKTIMYEDIAEHPIEGAKHLYEFVGLQFHNEIRQYVAEITAAGESNGVYGTTRSNSKEVAYKWRKQILFTESENIDQRCKGLYNVMGLRPADSVEKLRNANYSLRGGPRDLGDYLMPT